jgi:transglutaminase-like putative cysteine protease
LAILTGCASLSSRKPIEEEIPAREWDTESYSSFLVQNMAMLNEIYSTVYLPYDFVVDTVQGSLPIQRLINPAAVTQIVEDIRTADDSDKDLVSRLYQYVLDEYDYVVDANYWPEIADTLENKQGDCKGLSLLLMSLFIAAGYDSYAAISNGHMWVRGSNGHNWYTFEVDKDPGRNKVYQVQGFYDNPLFKVFIDRTYKRKRK